MLLPIHVNPVQSLLELGMSLQLTRSPTCGIHIAKHQEIFWLLSFNIVPSMLFVVIKQLIFTDPIQVKKIRVDDIVLGIDRSVVTNCQGPIIVWARQWPPNADFQTC